MPAITDIGILIVRSPDICGGRPHIANTRISVQRVANWYKMGLNAEEIMERIGSLSLEQIYAALTDYHANRDEVERYIRAEKQDYERLGNSLS